MDAVWLSRSLQAWEDPRLCLASTDTSTHRVSGPGLNLTPSCQREVARLDPSVWPCELSSMGVWSLWQQIRTRRWPYTDIVLNSDPTQGSGTYLSTFTQVLCISTVLRFLHFMLLLTSSLLHYISEKYCTLYCIIFIWQLKLLVTFIMILCNTW